MHLKAKLHHNILLFVVIPRRKIHEYTFEVLRNNRVKIEKVFIYFKKLNKNRASHGGSWIERE